MKCPIDNPEFKKFCRECGAKLVLPCPECGAEVIPGDKFCNDRGADGWVEKYEKELAEIS